MELIKVGKQTYYVKNNTNIGIYRANGNDVYLIDSGNDKEAGKKIVRIIEEHGWIIKGIINTHSHADHIGGNKYIQDKTSCKVFTSAIEKSFIESPVLEPSLLYGAKPLKELNNKFLLANPSDATTIKDNLLDGLEYFSIKGHSMDMIGIKTSDNVYFIGDSLFSEGTINKYSLFYIYDVEEYLNSLLTLKSLSGVLFIPSHGNASKNINDLIELNINKINEVTNTIFNFCEKGITFEELMQNIFNKYSLEMNLNQYVLIGCTIKAYLTYLCDSDKVIYKFTDNKMIWEQK